MRRILFALAVALGCFAAARPASSSIVTPSRILLDPTQDLQAAVDALPRVGADTSAAWLGGGTVMLGPGKYVITSTLMLPQSVVIEGAGIDATQIVYEGTSRTLDMVKLLASGAGLRNLSVWHMAKYDDIAPPDSGGCGVVVGGPGSGMTGYVLENVGIKYTPGIALRFIGHDERVNYRSFSPAGRDSFAYASWIYGPCTLENIRISQCNDRALVLGAGTTLLEFSHCDFSNSTGAVQRDHAPANVDIRQAVQLTFRECGFESTTRRPFVRFVQEFTHQGYNNAGIQFQRCWFESYWRNMRPDVGYFIEQGGDAIIGLSVEGCRFSRALPHDRGLVPFTSGLVFKRAGTRRAENGDPTVRLENGNFANNMVVLDTTIAMAPPEITFISEPDSTYIDSYQLSNNLVYSQKNQFTASRPWRSSACYAPRTGAVNRPPPGMTQLPSARDGLKLPVMTASQAHTYIKSLSSGQGTLLFIEGPFGSNASSGLYFVMRGDVDPVVYFVGRGTLVTGW